METEKGQDLPAPLLVLGMHRSGTSCLTGCLEEAGLFLGEVNTAANFNKKGNRENVNAMQLHEAVLERAGAAWNDPPSEPLTWSDDELAALAEILAAYPADRLWGAKDPRMLFLLDGWRRLTRPRFVGTFRHPAEVVESLVTRARAWKKPMEEEAAQGLWAAYNRRLLDEAAREGFPIIRYGDADYLDKVAGLVRDLGLTPPERFRFYEDGLRHNDMRDRPVPDTLAPLWDELNRAAI